jgi:hypothetical protein
MSASESGRTDSTRGTPDSFASTRVRKPIRCIMCQYTTHKVSFRDFTWRLKHLLYHGLISSPVHICQYSVLKSVAPVFRQGFHSQKYRIFSLTIQRIKFIQNALMMVSDEKPQIISREKISLYHGNIPVTLMIRIFINFQFITYMQSTVVAKLKKNVQTVNSVSSLGYRTYIYHFHILHPPLVVRKSNGSNVIFGLLRV